MNLFHLLPMALLALGFSGQPVPPKKGETPVAIIVSPPEKAEFIPWTDQKLTWLDFLCEPKKGSDAVASTSTSLGIAYQVESGKLTYDITCNFSKTKSWGLLKTDYILAHEQGHFDITEIFARKLNEALQNYEFSKKSFKKDVSEIYQAIVKQKEEFQKDYDGQTDHSRNRKVQYEWLEKIQKLLDETTAFATYP